jgi:hypothetical protein
MLEWVEQHVCFAESLHSQWFRVGLWAGCEMAMINAKLKMSDSNDTLTKRVENLENLTYNVLAGVITEIKFVQFCLENVWACVEQKESDCPCCSDLNIAWFCVGLECGRAAGKIRQKLDKICGQEWWELTQVDNALRGFAQSICYGNEQAESWQAALEYIKKVSTAADDSDRQEEEEEG